MMMLFLFVASLSFVAYAVFVHYTATDARDAVPARVWASVVAAGASLGAMVTAWLQG